jgi:hypothetical protein
MSYLPIYLSTRPLTYLPTYLLFLIFYLSTTNFPPTSYNLNTYLLYLFTILQPTY